MAKSKRSAPPSVDDSDSDGHRQNARSSRKNYRKMNDMRALNRSPEEIAAEKADKEQRQQDKVTKKKKLTTHLAQFENAAVDELLQKGRRAAQPPPLTQQKVPRAVVQTDTAKVPVTKVANKGKAHKQTVEADEDDDNDEEAPPQEEVPTENEFDEESHDSGPSDQDVAPSGDDDNDDYEDEPQPTKAKPPAVKKPKPGKALYNNVQHTRDALNGQAGQPDKRATNTGSKTKAKDKKGGVRNAYKDAPTLRNPPVQNASRAPAAPEPPADIEARYGGVVEDDDDDDEEEEHEQAKKSASTGKVARSTSQSIATVNKVIDAPKASTRTKKGKSRPSTPPKQSDLPDPIKHNFSNQYLLQALALYGVAQDTNNPYKINDEPQLFRTAFKHVYPSAINKQYGKNIASGELIFQLTSAKFRSWRNVLRTTGENVVHDLFTSVHPESGERLFPTAESIKDHVKSVLQDWGRKKGGQPFHWRVFTMTRKEGAYEDRLLLKILARHFEFIAKIDTAWLPSQEPFTAMVLALISYIRALSLWSTGVFNTKEAAAAMNDDKWGVEAEKQAKRLRAVMTGKPEKWANIVTLAKASMKKGASSRVQESEGDGGSSDEEMFLSGDEIEVEATGADGENKNGEDGEAAIDWTAAEGEDQTQMAAMGHVAGVATEHMSGSGEGAPEVMNEKVMESVKAKAKKARKARKDVRSEDGAEGDTEEPVPSVTRKRVRQAAMVGSGPEYDGDDSPPVHAGESRSAKRRKVGEAVTVNVDGAADTEHRPIV